MTVDLDDPKMEGYKPLQDFIDEDQDQSSRRIRDIPYGKPRESMQLSTGTLNFGEVLLDTTSNYQAVVLTNDGWDTVHIFGYDLNGPFQIIGSVPESLEPGETATVQVAFKPVAIGAVEGSLYFDTGNAAGDEFLDLLGEGVIQADPGGQSVIDGGSY